MKCFRLAAMTAAVVAGILATSVASAATTTVTSFGGFTLTPTAGVWRYSDSRTGTTGSTASIVDLTGAPGTLDSGQPLPTGAAKLTTNSTNESMAEVGVADDYGVVNAILANLKVSYSFYEATPDGNPAGAPSIKLTFVNPAYPGADKDVTLIYEPYWNNGGVAPKNAWTNVSIDATHGLFWQNGGFGQANSGGGPPLMTLADWATTFDSGFSNATLVDLKVGMGSYQPSLTGYFDDVSINNGAGIDRTYDFQAVPLPSSVGVGFCMLSGFGAIFAARKRFAKKAVIA